MPSTKKVHYFNNFTGGLNNGIAAQSLSLNETFDCADVDFGSRGGFTMRRGVGIAADVDWSSAADAHILGALSFGNDLLLVQNAAGALLTWDGSTLTSVATITDELDVANIEVWATKVYFANCFTAGNLVMKARSDATLSTAATLANTFNDDYTAPAGGCMPLAKQIAQHSGYMWVADTVESAVRYRSRVRWSHPLQPEDWATEDYFDFDPDDETDQITALVPFKNMLLVFKKNSVWGVYGTGSDSFIPERIASAGGTVAPSCVSVSSGIAYWWSSDGELFAFDGSRVAPVGDRIKGVVDDESVDVLGAAWVQWAGGVLWVSLPLAAGGMVCFVFDPRVGRSGAWTKYSLEPTSLFWWNIDGVDPLFMTLDGLDGLFAFGNTDRVQDEFVYGEFTPIPAYYCTSWFAGADTAQKKRYKRLRVTAAARASCDLIIDVFYDFNTSRLGRTLVVPIVADETPAMVWGVGSWGVDKWGGAGDEYAFERTSSSGRGHAIMWKFSVADASTRWWVDSFTIPFFEKGY